MLYHINCDLYLNIEAVVHSKEKQQTMRSHLRERMVCSCTSIADNNTNISPSPTLYRTGRCSNHQFRRQSLLNCYIIVIHDAEYRLNRQPPHFFLVLPHMGKQIALTDIQLRTVKAYDG